MTDKSYNGWTNYETWCVNMWLANDESLCNEAAERAADVAGETESRSSYWTLEESHRYTLAQNFKDWVCDDLAPDLGASFAADLLGSALENVDWDEIATSWLEEAKNV